jgi:hypothetical protein
MKSKLRSRWYRPNEKPLETSTEDKKNTEPFGEIQNTGEKLVDDLSKAKPSPHNRSENRPSRKGQNHFKSNNPTEKRNDRNRPGRSKKTDRKSHKAEGQSRNQNSKSPQTDRDKDKRENHNSSKQKPKRKRQNKTRSEHEPLNKTDSSKSKKNNNEIKKKTGFGGFISKLFGG